MPIRIEEIPIERVELNIEITHHPLLLKEMYEVQMVNQVETGVVYDFSVMLGVIAAYCEVVVDGYYVEGEINKLCQLLTDKLRAKRMGLVIAPAGSLN